MSSTWLFTRQILKEYFLLQMMLPIRWVTMKNYVLTFLYTRDLMRDAPWSVYWRGEGPPDHCLILPAFILATQRTSLFWWNLVCFSSGPVSLDTGNILLTRKPGRENSIMASVSVCQADRPGSSPARSVCFRKAELYQNVSTCLHRCQPLVHQRPSMCYHVYVIMHVKDP